MFFKTTFLLFTATFLMKVNSWAVSSESGETQEKVKLESIKAFVRIVERLNLNVSIVGSVDTYPVENWSSAMTIHMPTNKEFLLAPTLTNEKQQEFLNLMNQFTSTEGVAARTRVIKIKDGKDETAQSQEINSDRLINSTSIDYLTTYRDGRPGFPLNENQVGQTIHHFVLKNPTADGVKSVQVHTSNVPIEELDVEKDFPKDILKELKRILPRLYLTYLSSSDLVDALISSLENQFDVNVNVIVGALKFALGSKTYAQLAVGDDDFVMLVFIK